MDQHDWRDNALPGSALGGALGALLGGGVGVAMTSGRAPFSVPVLHDRSDRDRWRNIAIPAGTAALGGVVGAVLGGVGGAASGYTHDRRVRGAMDNVHRLERGLFQPSPLLAAGNNAESSPPAQEPKMAAAPFGLPGLDDLFGPQPPTILDSATTGAALGGVAAGLGGSALGAWLGHGAYQFASQPNDFQRVIDGTMTLEDHALREQILGDARSKYRWLLEAGSPGGAAARNALAVGGAAALGGAALGGVAAPVISQAQQALASVGMTTGSAGVDQTLLGATLGALLSTAGQALLHQHVPVSLSAPATAGIGAAAGGIGAAVAHALTPKTAQEAPVPHYDFTQILLDALSAPKTAAPVNLLGGSAAAGRKGLDNIASGRGLFARGLEGIINAITPGRRQVGIGEALRAPEVSSALGSLPQHHRDLLSSVQRAEQAGGGVVQMPGQVRKSVGEALRELHDANPQVPSHGPAANFQSALQQAREALYDELTLGSGGGSPFDAAKQVSDPVNVLRYALRPNGGQNHPTPYRAVLEQLAQENETFGKIRGALTLGADEIETAGNVEMGHQEALNHLFQQHPALADAIGSAQKRLSDPGAVGRAIEQRPWLVPAAIGGVGLGAAAIEPAFDVLKPTVEAYGDDLRRRLDRRPLWQQAGMDVEGLKSLARGLGDAVGEGAVDTVGTVASRTARTLGAVGAGFTPQGFDDILKSDPILSGAAPHEREALRKAYGELQFAAPTLAAVPSAASNYLRQIHTSGRGADALTLATLAKADSDVTGRRR